MREPAPPESFTSEQSVFITCRDAPPLLALAALFAVMLIGTWQRWTQPIIDHGREMNLPARLLAGEQLYADVQFLYGPFAPYFNAVLYRLFGIHLNVLHLSGGVCAVIIALLIYLLARQLMNEREAALAAGLVIVLCAFKATANYISPYAYAALYGLVFALLALWAALGYLRSHRPRWMLLAGSATGLALACKLDLFLPAAIALAVAWLIVSLAERKIQWRAALAAIVPVIIFGGGAYALILKRVGWRTLIEDNYALFFNFPPQLIYYNRNIGGFADWPRSLANILAATGTFLLLCAISALSGWLMAGRRKAEAGVDATRIWKVLAAALALWLGMVRLFGANGDSSPLAAAPLLLAAVFVASAVRWWHMRKADNVQKQLMSALLVITAFSLGAIARVLLNVTTSGPYTPFFVPTVIIVVLYLLFRAAPSWLLSNERARDLARRTAIGMIAVAIIAVGAGSILRLHKRNTYRVTAERGSFLTLPSIGKPLAEAVSFARQHTAPNDYVLVLPEGTSINFLAERRYPLREEIVHPGFLAGPKEAETIERISRLQVPLILVANIDTSEFRDRAFGSDYNQELMRWIESHYHLKAVFGQDTITPIKPEGFFIQAYERNQ
ncbi:MAG TPA: glycosyltransferase family 39 protein [Blastocatellia bacterium]|nr:glycosyltransferase family 39 protein [Blastocatellia bacterium]